MKTEISTNIKEVEEIVKAFFHWLQTQTDSIEVTQDEEAIFSIQIQTQDSGIIIGPHGKNLASIQIILKLLLSKKFDKKIKIHLEVNDYMASKDERLFEFIKREIGKVEQFGRDIKLPFYWAYERKKIHSYVSEYENDDIFTKSQWEGKERRLFICTKNPKPQNKETPKKKTTEKKERLTIDIDWEDI